MGYVMFLDDVRDPGWVYPTRDCRGWIVCRSVDEAINVIADLGWPEWISFDHDLGEGEPTGMDLAKWLVNGDCEHGSMPRGWSYAVHSANPVGAANIRGLLDGYLAAKQG